MPLHSHFRNGLKKKISERQWWTRRLLSVYIIKNLRDTSQQALKMPDQKDFRIFSNQFWLFLWFPSFSLGVLVKNVLSLYHIYLLRWRQHNLWLQFKVVWFKKSHMWASFWGYWTLSPQVESAVNYPTILDFDLNSMIE